MTRATLMPPPPGSYVALLSRTLCVGLTLSAAPKTSIVGLSVMVRTGVVIRHAFPPAAALDSVISLFDHGG
jgi:hypothetical protein